MKLISFEMFSDPTPRTGVLLQDDILDLTPLGVADAVTAVAAGTQALRVAIDMGPNSLIARSAVRLLAPIRPPRIFCVGLN
jgi:hypothetical protein